jgi:hypothetical protein
MNIASIVVGIAQISILMLIVKIATIQAHQYNLLAHHDGDLLRWKWDLTSNGWLPPEHRLFGGILPPRIDYAAPGRSHQLLPLAVCMYADFVGASRYETGGRRCNFE